MPKHLPVYKDRHFFLHQRDQDKFFRVFHLDHSVTESGSQPGHPAQQPYDMEQEKAWGSANLTQGSHSNKTSSVAPRLPTASGGLLSILAKGGCSQREGQEGVVFQGRSITNKTKQDFLRL